MNEKRIKKAKLGLVAAAVIVGGLGAALIATGGFSGSASAFEQPRVAKQMRALNSEPLPAGEVPEEVQRAQQQLPDPRAQGVAIPGHVWRLAAGLGMSRVAIYAFPTTGGAVCLVVSETTHAATCVDSFDRRTGSVRFVMYEGVGTALTILGLASDAVTSISVLVEASAHEAVLRGNAFFWQSSDPAASSESLTALLVTQADGTVVRRSLDFGGRRDIAARVPRSRPN